MFVVLTFEIFYSNHLFIYDYIVTLALEYYRTVGEDGFGRDQTRETSEGTPSPHVQRFPC